eukprot:scaffold128031_cov22-Tisochrysis_lutea.AAC.1
MGIHNTVEGGRRRSEKGSGRGCEAPVQRRARGEKIKKARCRAVRVLLAFFDVSLSRSSSCMNRLKASVCGAVCGCPPVLDQALTKMRRQDLISECLRVPSS